jgi:guanylate kinase
MKNIFCLIGKSGTGKDTVLKYILKETDLHPIRTYTTRPQRTNETQGEEYMFVNKPFLDSLKSSVIECREYNTEKGLWYYATINDGQFDMGDSILIASPQQYQALKTFFENSDKRIIPLYIYIDDGTRMQRLISREMLEREPNYSEICRRYESDKKDFEIMNNERRFLNYALRDCVEELKKYIQEVQNAD